MFHLNLLLSLLLVGCATSGNPAVKDETITSQIKIGISTKEDVRELLGKPTVSMKNAGPSGVLMETWSYGYSRHETNPLIYVPIVGLFVLAGGGTGEMETATFTVTFDPQGLVTGVGTGETYINLGGLAAPTTIHSESEMTVETPSGTSTEPFRSETKTEIHVE